MRGRFDNLVGKKFGKLTVQSLAYRHKTDGSYWYCSCDCSGKIREKPYKGSSMKGGESSSCGCYRLEQISKRRKPSGAALLKQKYIGYRNNAEARGYRFDLTYEDFLYFAFRPCTYCGREGVNEAESSWDSVRYNGIDRVNNQVGYVLTNCETCCGECNILKGKLDVSVFLALIKTIAAHQVKLPTVTVG